MQHELFDMDDVSAMIARPECRSTAEMRRIDERVWHTWKPMRLFCRVRLLYRFWKALEPLHSVTLQNGVICTRDEVATELKFVLKEFVWCLLQHCVFVAGILGSARIPQLVSPALIPVAELFLVVDAMLLIVYCSSMLLSFLRNIGLDV